MHPLTSVVCCSSEQEHHAIDFDTVETLTKQAVAKIALFHDFDSATSSSLNYLKDLTLLMIDNMAKSLRGILDNEALTGIALAVMRIVCACVFCEDAQMAVALGMKSCFIVLLRR